MNEAGWWAAWESALGFAELWDTLLPVGRDAATGGYRRYSFTKPDLPCGEWFASAAAQRGMRASTDRNGNLWGWWDAPGATGPAVLTASHLDSVPAGGAFDGPLGVVSAFAAIDQLRAQGFTPARRVAVAAFCEEEGGRFGLACLGSRLLTGAVQPAAARELRDGDGVTLAEAMAGAGLDPDGRGADEELLASVGAVVELHIEQGSALDGLGAAVGIAEGIWPHGRWRLDFTGRADHAGTTRLADRRDPMLPFAAAVLEARQAASAHGALATFGKVTAEPGAANAISSVVSAWLDARAPDQSALDRTVGQIEAAARRGAGGPGWPGGGTKARPSAGSARLRPPRGGPPTSRGSRPACAVSRSRPRWSSTPRCGPGWPRRSRPRACWPRCCPPGPATTPGCSRPGCRRRCCSCATRPGCPTRRRSTPSRPTAR